MIGIETITFYLGIALCIAALFGVMSWVGQAMIGLAGSKQSQEESNRALREAIRQQAPQNPQVINGEWNGYRGFVVTKLVHECNNTVSVYLEPEDGKPIPNFKPGQHITLRFQPKGKTKPLVRCYSLSCAPGQPYYRISVKHVEDRGEGRGPGQVSTIINRDIKVGQRIPVKAPSGHFYLDEKSNDVMVLLAGGIGITPMVSMLDHVIQTNSKRSVVLIHGTRNGKEQQFGEHIRKCAAENPNVHVVSCFSRPGPEDIKGVHYQVDGYATIELLKAVLPNPVGQFYMCGPPAFMSALHRGLKEWGVEDSRIQFEQFGPSTIRNSGIENVAKHDEPDPVSFLGSSEIALWNAGYESLLEMAEANDVEIESGCRAGSCGTCETAIANGKVKYAIGENAKCRPGCCLPCIAVPDGPLELEA